MPCGLMLKSLAVAGDDGICYVREYRYGGNTARVLFWPVRQVDRTDRWARSSRQQCPVVLECRDAQVILPAAHPDRCGRQIVTLVVNAVAFRTHGDDAELDTLARERRTTW